MIEIELEMACKIFMAIRNQARHDPKIRAVWWKLRDQIEAEGWNPWSGKFEVMNYHSAAERAEIAKGGR
jgi:hypothetical protein